MEVSLCAAGNYELRRAMLSGVISEELFRRIFFTASFAGYIVIQKYSI